MEKEESVPKAPGEDWTQWEVVDVQSSPRRGPEGEGEWLGDNKKEELGSVQQNSGHHGSQQQRGASHRQSANKRNGNEEKKENSDGELLLCLTRENEEMRKKLSDMSMERERERERQEKCEAKYSQALDRLRLEHLELQTEKEKLQKERENIKHEKALIEKERKELLLQKQQQQQQRDRLSAFDINSKPQSNPRGVHAAHASDAQLVSACSAPGQNERAGWLTVDGVLNDKEWVPCIEKEYGWILHNYSGKPLTFKAKLERVGDGQEVTICEEGVLIEYHVETDAELKITAHARAPALCGKYATCWKLVGEDQKEIGPRLEMKLVVKSNLDETKENAVRTMLVDLGFTDREVVIAALTANKWDVNVATQQLMDQVN